MAAGRRALALLLFLAARGHGAKKAAKAADVADELLYLTDSTLEEALNGHRLLLISVNVRLSRHLCPGARLPSASFLTMASTAPGA